jgi:pyruvate carboxylase
MVRFTAATLLLLSSTVLAFYPSRPAFSSATTKTTALHVATEEPPMTDDSMIDPSTFITKEAGDLPVFRNVMAANRAEIAVRIMRAATELNSGTVAIYGHEDRYSQHRWGADQSFLLEKHPDASPISAYLDMDQIIKIAKDAGVDAIHPGYGFLSESPAFAEKCGAAGITFVGPTVENLNVFSDKTTARTAAIAAGVPVVPGSDGAMKDAEEIIAFVENIGLPVILKVRFKWAIAYYYWCHSSTWSLTNLRSITNPLLYITGRYGRWRKGHARRSPHGGLGALFRIRLVGGLGILWRWIRLCRTLRRSSSSH